jgi:phosphoglycolate phosphatase
MRAILFDLDGTLIDSQRDVLGAFSAAFGGLGRPVPPKERLLGLIGRRLEDCFAAVLPGDPEAWDEGARLFRAWYREHCLDTTRPYPGVDAALATLRARHRLALCTMKRGDFARRIVGAFGWEGLFCATLGSEEGYAGKPAPDMALELCRRVGATPGEAALVGDTAVDAAMASAAGLGAFYFTAWGYGSPESLNGFPVTATLSSPGELVPTLIARSS